MLMLNAIVQGLWTAVLGAGMVTAMRFVSPWLSGQKGPDAELLLGREMLLGGMAGALAGFLLGAFSSRLLSASTYWRGVSWLLMLWIGVEVVRAGVSRWEMRNEPRLKGERLSLELELRLPAGMAWPLRDAVPELIWQADGTVDGPHGLGVSQKMFVEGRWEIRFEMAYLVNRKSSVFEFLMGEGARPRFSADTTPRVESLEWSAWQRSALEQPAGPFEMRYRFRLEPETPSEEPAPSWEEQATSDFEALPENAPVSQWVRFLDDRMPNSVIGEAKAVIERRQPEVAELIRSTDRVARSQGLEAAGYLERPSAAVQAALLDEGRLVAAEIRGFKNGDATEVRSRYQDWRLAWWRVHGLVPDLDAASIREIAGMAQAAGRSGAIREAVSDAGVTVGRLVAEGR